MEKFYFKHSLKNIPTPPLHGFIIQLMDRTIDFVKRLRWKAFFFDNNISKEETAEKFGFNSQKNPPSNKNLEGFEKDLFEMIRNIKFTKETSTFQISLKKKIQEINSSDKIYVKADKSSNIYKIPPQQYNELTKTAIGKQYKPDRENTVKRINNDSLKCASSLKIEDRMGFMRQAESYILLKDHKVDFINKKQTRLINPAKTELGKVSKKILQNIVESLNSKLKYNLWVNSNDTIQWFCDIENKHEAVFIQFDIAEYYPSISEEMLDNALELAKQHVEITDLQIEIIKKCRTSVIFYNNQAWIKANTTNGFDTPMGAFDSAQVSDLVGIYILHFLSRSFQMRNIGLYRDDGLMVVEKSNGPLVSRWQKRLYNAFKLLGLKIEITANVKEVNYLDLTLNLDQGDFKPFMKENQTPKYVNINSNHPKHIIGHIPCSINRRINTNSSSRKIFDESKIIYEEALRKSGHNYKMQYEVKKSNNDQKVKAKNRKRKIMWYNPPFCKLSNINIGRTFIYLIRKHFTAEHPLHRIINKNSVKISYSCTRNMEQVIKAHNQKTLKQFQDKKLPTAVKQPCNCRRKDTCPLKNKCNIENAVYMATIFPKEHKEKKKYYIGVAKGPWKLRFNNHTQSFKRRESGNSTALSQHYWELLDHKKTPVIQWEILTRTRPPENLTDKCLLCLEESTNILRFSKRDSLLNKRAEITSKCRHQRELLIKPT